MASRDLKPGRMVSNETSTQWAADYMAFTFSNLLKAGAVHRYKTFAVLYVPPFVCVVDDFDTHFPFLYPNVWRRCLPSSPPPPGACGCYSACTTAWT